MAVVRKVRNDLDLGKYFTQCIIVDVVKIPCRSLATGGILLQKIIVGT